MPGDTEMPFFLSPDSNTPGQTPTHRPGYIMALAVTAGGLGLTIAGIVTFICHNGPGEAELGLAFTAGGGLALILGSLQKTRRAADRFRRRLFRHGPHPFVIPAKAENPVILPSWSAQADHPASRSEIVIRWILRLRGG